MRVLILMDDSPMPGGHKVQAERTVEALRDLGLDAVLGVGADVAWNGFDVVHAIGARREQIERGRRAGIPLVMSTIYWNRRYVLGLDRPGTGARSPGYWLRLAGSVARRGPMTTLARVRAPLIAKKELFESADMLLPNSSAEAGAIRSELKVATPMRVVPNGVDAETFVPPATEHARDGVLYVGRVEPHKNQLGLIEALSGSGVRVCIAGPVHPHHQEYFRACQEAADPLAEFITEREQAGLAALYQRCAVHAMPSWFETTGLTSLEAALCGAAVVTTGRGYVREYFADLVSYCDPANPASISAAVERALAIGPSEELRERILLNYTWAHTARATADAYSAVLSSHEPRSLLP